MTTEKELGEALKNDQDIIEIEGDLKNKVLKIKATGKVAWGACIVSITVAVAAAVVIISTGGTATPVAGPLAGITLGVAAPTLGMSTAITATGIAIAGGGIGALNKLRKYKVEKILDTKIILHRK